MGAVVNPPDLQPAVAGILCLVLAGLHAAGSVAVLRVVSVCRHHMDRLREVDELEARLKALQAKQDAKRQEGRQ